MVLGAFYCIVAALGTSVVNGCLRELTVECDRFWALAVKESVAAVVVGPWIALQIARGKMRLPGRRAIAALVMAGLVSQVVGNLPCMWAFSVVGLSVVLPVMFGAYMTAGVVLGRVFLGETVSARSLLAVGLLISAVVLLSMGAGTANQAIAAGAKVQTGAFWVGLAIAASAMAGVAFCVMAVVIRRATNDDTSPMIVAFIMPVMGPLCFGPLGLATSGWDGLTSCSSTQFALMLAAGAINLVSFLSLIHGLRRVPVAHANVLSASQVAMGAVIGMTVFGEPPGPWLVLGVTLTIVGMVVIGRTPVPDPEMGL